MKKSILITILMCTIMVFQSCSVAPKAPSNGIWYCKELDLAIEWGENTTTVHSYDISLSSMDLQVRDWIDGGFDIIYDDGSGNIIDIYSGWKKYTDNNKFVIILYSKANPIDNFKTQIELDDEEYTFVKIQNYDDISNAKVD